MIIPKEIKSKMPIQDLSNVYVVADFDRTITKGSCKTSWSILAESDLVPKSYVTERYELYEHYRPIEIDESLDEAYRMQAMKDWFRKHIELFVKYRMKEDVFQKACTDLRILEFRPGAKEFIEFLHANQIPLIIISAGIGNFIEIFLKQNQCYFDNVYVSSNTILFKDGIAVGVGENIIHSLNKNEVSLPTSIQEKVRNRHNVILLGDQISDLKMVDKSAHSSVLTVGFVAKDCTPDMLKPYFDIVCEESDSYQSLQALLFGGKRKNINDDFER